MTQTYSQKDTLYQVKTNHTLRRRINAKREGLILLRIKNNLERRFAKRMARVFRRWVSSSMYLYREFGVFEPNAQARNLSEDMIPAIQSHFRRTFRTIFDYNEEKYDRATKATAEAFVFGRVKEFETLIEQYFNGRNLILSGIAINLANRIDKDIARFRAEGLTLNQIAVEISQKYRTLTRVRANMIARTETHNAAGYANHRYHQFLATDEGINMVKEWVAVGDDRTRSFHAEADGQRRQMDEAFDVGGARMQHAGDPAGGLKNIINCRCSIIYVDARDVVD